MRGVSPRLGLPDRACRACRDTRRVTIMMAMTMRAAGCRRAYGSAAASGTTDAANDALAGVDDLTRRPPKFIPDYLVPMPSHLLTTTLTDLLAPASPSSSPSPASSSPPAAPTSTASSPIIQHPPRPLPQGHHLVYFPIQAAPSRLARDGADPDHGPGGPFARRMWAGGEVAFRRGWRERLLLDGRPWACEETIERVDVKGVSPAEKVFVDVWRRYGGLSTTAREEDESRRPREWDIEERRTLVFMRNDEGTSSSSSSSSGTAPATPRRPIKFPHPASYSVALTPSATHLFHFSALTFNAHAIHLDTGYARGTDGHRGLLVHGPLTLALMLRVLAEQQEQHGFTGGSGRPVVGNVRRIAYRNYAPLYVDEEMRVCVRRPAELGAAWDVWVEGPDGGLAVKGTAEMETE